MKLELWSDDMIRFMKNASEYGTYNQVLLEKMQPYLTPRMHICDAGSGLGYLSLALSPHVGKVTAVEKHPHASAVLEENCRKRGIANVEAVCGDMDTVSPAQPYDAMVFCFFGDGPQILRLAKQQCRGRVFVFTRNYKHHRFSVGTHPTGMEGFSDLQELLRKKNIPTREETFPAENGQPLESMEEARRFYEIYSMDGDNSLLTEEFLRSKVIPTGRADFPLYLPHERKVAFVTFLAEDIPEEIG